jgi:hypothetical protein
MEKYRYLILSKSKQMVTTFTITKMGKHLIFIVRKLWIYVTFKIGAYSFLLLAREF